MRLSILSHANYAILAYILYVLILLATLDPTIKSRSWCAGKYPLALFFLISLVLLLAARRNILRYDPAINPDEALMAANAMLAQHGWLNWNIIDPLTSGPLNSMILVWPHLFGGEITLFSARLTGIACVYATLVCLFLALRRLTDRTVALAAVAPAFVFIIVVHHFDFVHYSSEQLPVLLLSLGIYLFAASFRWQGLGYLLAAAFVMGLVPFAKLQAMPQAAIIGFFVLARAAQTGQQQGGAKQGASRAVMTAGIAILPALIFLVPLAVCGGLDDFVKRYLLQLGQRYGPQTGDDLQILLAMIHLSIFVNLVRAYALFGLGAIICALIAARRVPINDRRHIAPVVKWNLALAFVQFPAAIVAVALPGTGYIHYLWLMLPSLVMATGAVLAVENQCTVPARSSVSRAFRLALAGAALLIVAGSTPYHRSVDIFARAGGAFLQAKPFSSEHDLDWLRPEIGDRIVCWGWQPQCYVDAAIPPATREATNENELDGTPLQAYFRTHFMADIARSDPAYVIDFAARGNFGFSDPQHQGIASFPAFAQLMASKFVLLSRNDPLDQCPRLYIRRDRLSFLQQSVIPFISVTATASLPLHPPSALDDNNIFETCNDNWLLPKAVSGAVQIEFDKPEPFRTLAILNTRNGKQGNYGTDQVIVSVYLAGKLVASQALHLARFPRWTYYRMHRTLTADAAKIQIVSFYGDGGGLNEVKAYRN